MKLGIKVSLARDSAQDIRATRPAMAEVWFNASRADQYGDLFAYMKRQPMDVGLHYWGALPSGLLTNIAYPDPDIIKPSLALIRDTIDIAARNRFSYVNIHTDMRILMHVNFDTMQISAASEPAKTDVCTRTFFENAAALKQYADRRGIVLTVETVPQRDHTSWHIDSSRQPAVNLYQLPIQVQADLGNLGFAIANDFGHTACNLITGDGSAVWQFLYSSTKALAPATRLIHLGFIVPPYNGVDLHDTLDNPMLDSSAAIPNKKQMTEILQLFKNRDDVWILVEPKNDHVKNYFLAREILEKAGVFPT